MDKFYVDEDKNKFVGNINDFDCADENDILQTLRYMRTIDSDRKLR